MPTYDFTHPVTGKTVSITGDAPPDEATIDQIFAETANATDYRTVGNPDASPQETEKMRREFVSKEGSPWTKVKENPVLKSVGTAVSNVPSSAWNLAKGIWGSFAEQDPITFGGNIIRHAPEILDTYKKRYGGIENVKNTFEQDPVGMAADAAMVYGGVKSIPKVAKVGGRTLASAIPENLERSLYKRGMKANTGFTGLKLEELNKRVDTALNEGIPLNSKGVEKLKDTVKSINKEIQERVKLYAANGESVPLNGVVAPVADVKAAAASQAFPKKPVAQVNQTVSEFANNPAIEKPVFDAAGTNPDVSIPIDQAQVFKQSINKDLFEFYDAMGKAPDKGPYLARQWVQRSKAAIGDGLRNMMGEVAPELKTLNKREGALLNLNKSLERAVNRIGQRDIVSLKFLTALVHNPKTAFAEFVLNNPNIQSNLAIAIRKARNRANNVQPEAVPPMPGITPKTPIQPYTVQRTPLGLQPPPAPNQSIPRTPMNLGQGDATYFDPLIGAARPKGIERLLKDQRGMVGTNIGDTNLAFDKMNAAYQRGDMREFKWWAEMIDEGISKEKGDLIRHELNRRGVKYPGDRYVHQLFGKEINHTDALQSLLNGEWNRGWFNKNEPWNGNPTTPIVATKTKPNDAVMNANEISHRGPMSDDAIVFLNRDYFQQGKGVPLQSLKGKTLEEVISLLKNVE